MVKQQNSHLDFFTNYQSVIKVGNKKGKANDAENGKDDNTPTAPEKEMDRKPC